MPQYAMLVLPSANRVYSRTAVQMMKNEIAVLDRFLLGDKIEELEERELGGVPYLVFRSPSLTGRERGCLANASSMFAMFELRDSMLLPIEVERLDRYDDDLISIPKYVGKTNEQFTKLLLNVTAAAALHSADRFLDTPLKVLDPLCGRGTTLNQAMMYGWDAYGIEIDQHDFEAYSAFIQRWMKSKSIKHKAVKNRVRREGRTLGQRLLVEFAASRELHKAGELQTLEMTNADTLRSTDIYRRRFFDLIVTDAPYGVQHASVSSSRARSRNPTDLLAAAIPAWATLLRAGGTIGLSWNANVLSRTDLGEMLSTSGLEPIVDEPFQSFAHRVDQAIDRDLMVARLPGASH